MKSFHGGRVVLHAGDCREVLRTLGDNSIDSVVTDPPYFLTSIAKRFGNAGSAPCQFGEDGAFKRLSGGFMQKQWDSPDASPIDPNFANWFAGFVDGEGCFSVHKKQVNGCETYDCQFAISLRADEKPTVINIQKQLGGIGTIADRPAPKEGGGKPQVRYCISSQKDCQRLRAILEVFPLRAKKLRDFEIWSKGLDAWLAHEPGQSWKDVGYFRDKLMAVRQYGAVYRPEELFHYEWASEVLRVLKPGGFCAAFSSTRTYHRMACAIEDAGFITHPMLAWVFAQGFPKAHRVELEGWEGWRYGAQALKPAWEPIYFGQKPFSEKTGSLNIARWGTGAINVDATRIPSGKEYADKCARVVGLDSNRNGSCYGGWNGKRTDSFSAKGRWPANLCHDGSPEVLAGFPETKSGSRAEGVRKGMGFHGANGDGGPEIIGDSGSAARFFASFSEDSCSINSLVKDVELNFSLLSEHAVSVLCRAVTASMHPLELQRQSYQAQNTSVSETELSLICESVIEAIQSIERRSLLELPLENITVKLGHVTSVAMKSQTGIMTITISLLKLDRFVEVVTFNTIAMNLEVGAEDYVSRFRYCAKASAQDRIGSSHPTVKPIALIRWLVRLITPPNGTCLDLFAGTGTTGEAAYREGFSAVLIEREAEYQADIEHRMGLIKSGKTSRNHAAAKARGRDVDHGPLFA